MSAPVTAKRAAAGALTLALTLSAAGTAAKHAREPSAEVTVQGRAIFWSDPSDWATRNLFYGPGGRQHQPHGPFTFEKEDLGGTSPKFTVHDADGVKWKVKLGLDARPETAASRIVWAAGYYANEDYFVRKMQIGGMPEHLHRGNKLLRPDGAVYNARLKRESGSEETIGVWQWNHDEFTGSREWNGLRVLMSLLNNWDLKDENNAVYRCGSTRIYMVSDLGACFGTAGRSWPPERAKDNLESYSRSRFIRRITSGMVDFQAPARPMFVFLVNPKEYVGRVGLEGLGRDVPRADAKWLGNLMARLSPAQIHDAFRAAGYSREEVEALYRLVEDRIAELTDL
jgi:hypothetical protein